jgi:hypothetical protein
MPFIKIESSPRFSYGELVFHRASVVRIVKGEGSENSLYVRYALACRCLSQETPLLESKLIKHIGHEQSEGYASVVPIRSLYHRYTILYSSLQNPHKRFGKLSHHSDSRRRVGFSCRMNLQ